MNELEFPRLVYKAADKFVLAEDAKQHAALLAEGWSASVPEAIAAASIVVSAGKSPDPLEKPALDGSNTPEAPSDNAPATRAELEAKATELSITFTSKTSDKKLGDLIAATLES